jgi:glycosyltransferase involved in cell wall biosynthesis
MVDHNDTLNVMQVILNLERAGAQEVVRTLAQHLPKHGCTVTVCAFQNGPLRSEIEKTGVKVELLRRPRYSVVFLPLFLIEMFRIRHELARLIEIHQIDVAQTHILEVLDFLVLTLRRDTDLRVVLWTMQNTEFLPTMKHWLLRPKRFVYRHLYRLLASRVDGFIAVSEEVRHSLIRQIGPIQSRIFTLCNAVDVDLFERSGDKAALCYELGLDAHARLVATVGRLTEQKGHCYLIKAAAYVVPAHPDLHFLFLGDGELREDLKSQAREAGLADNIHFLGLRDDVPDVLAAADLFVLPSLWEGLSVALLEAMAAGKPIVATAVSGTTEAMVPGTTGLIVPPSNVQALADAISELVSDPEQAQVMGRAAKQHVTENFSAQKQAEEHAMLYRRLLNKYEDEYA